MSITACRDCRLRHDCRLDGQCPATPQPMPSYVTLRSHTVMLRLHLPLCAEMSNTYEASAVFVGWVLGCGGRMSSPPRRRAGKSYRNRRPGPDHRGLPNMVMGWGIPWGSYNFRHIGSKVSAYSPSRRCARRHVVVSKLVLVCLIPMVVFVEGRGMTRRNLTPPSGIFDSCSLPERNSLHDSDRRIAGNIQAVQAVAQAGVPGRADDVSTTWT